MYNGEYSSITNQSPRNFMCGDKVYIFDEITSENCAHLICALSTYIMDEKNINEKKVISIFLNSPGGQTNVAFTIISLMNLGRINGIKFNTFVFGQACSAASMIACCGDYRVIGKYSTNMIHFGYYCDAVTKKSEIEKLANNIEFWHKRVSDVYLENSNGKLNEKILKTFMSDEQTYLSAEDCLKYSIADSIVEEDLDELISKREETEKLYKDFEKWNKNKDKESK